MKQVRFSNSNVDVTLYQGDCLDLLSMLKHKVDFVLSDPPYAITACSWDKAISLPLLWNAYSAITSGTVALFACQPFTTAVIDSNLSKYRYCWYWVKNQGTNFFHADSMPIRKVEEIVIFNKSAVYNPQISTGHVPTNSIKNGLSEGKVYSGKNKRNHVGGKTERHPTNVLEFDCVGNLERVHSSQKPVALLKYLVRTYTNKGDVVLDNCMGSGSTGVAAVMTGRSFIGIEKDPATFKTACQRIETAIHSPGFQL